MGEVFVSHRSPDAPLAIRLATDLRNAGHTVWLDEWRIELGESVVERINQGLAGASDVLVCCSDVGVDTPWMGREWMSSLARQLNGKGVKLIPVLLSGRSVPAILEDIKYADLMSDWHRGIAQLLSVIS